MPLDMRRSVRIVLLTFGLLVLGAALYSVRWVALVIAIGIGIGVLIAPVVDAISRKCRVPKGLAAFLVFILLVSFIAGLFYLIFSVVSGQLIPILHKFPTFVQSMMDRLAKWTERYPSIHQQVIAFRPEQAVGQSLGNIANTVLAGLEIGTRAVVSIFFMIVLALYIAISPTSYFNGILSLFPAYRRTRIAVILHESARSFRRWFGSQALALASVGSFVGLGLWFVGFEYWPLFALITAVFDFIPYLGSIFAFCLALLLTLSAQPEKVYWVAGVYFIANQLEAHLIVPLVMKGLSELPPVYLMTLMLVLGSWFGFLGILIAPPLLAVFRTIYFLTYAPRMDELVSPPVPAS